MWPLHEHSHNVHSQLQTFISKALERQVSVINFPIYYMKHHIFWSHISYLTFETSNGPGLGSNQTEPLSHDLTVYRFQKSNGLIWFEL